MSLFKFGRSAGRDEKNIATYNAQNDHTSDEGQLSVDILETTRDIAIVAPIAGVRSSDIDIIVSDHTLTIKGDRIYDIDNDIDNILVSECFWGKFSRSIILPDSANTEKVNAKMRHGILYITIPKSDYQTTVKVVDED